MEVKKGNETTHTNVRHDIIHLLPDGTYFKSPPPPPTPKSIIKSIVTAPNQAFRIMEVTKWYETTDTNVRHDIIHFYFLMELISSLLFLLLLEV